MRRDEPSPTQEPRGSAQPHTPGRWSFHGWPNLPRVSTPDGKSICGVHKIGRFSGAVSDEVVANGHLIAAAPDGYAANREAADFLLSYFGPVASDDPAGWSDEDARDVYQKLAAAIAKAEGR